MAIHGTSLFAGTAGGGLFRSTDNGTTWSALGFQGSNVNSLAVSGANLFAGTDSGVSVLTDDGTGWREVNVVSAGTPVLHLAVKESHLFVVTNRTGLLRYAGNGASWTKTDSILAGEFVSTLAFQGRNLFAGTRNGVFHSTDNGASWTRRNNGLRATQVREVFSHGSRLLAAMDDSLFLSIDSGASWRAANRGVLAAGFDAFAASGSNLFAGGSGGVYRSTDGGMTWRETTIGLVHALTYSLTAGPAGVLFASTEGDLFKSSDGGGSWTKADSGMTNVAAKTVAIHPDGSTLFAGTSLRSRPQASGIFRSKDNGRTWAPAMAGFPDHYREVDGFAFNSQGHVFAGDYHGGVHRTTDHGRTWTQVLGQGISMQASDMVIDSAGNIFVVSVGGETGIWISTDNGDSWANANPGFSWEFYVQGLEIVGAHLYASTAFGVWKRPLSELTASIRPHSRPYPVGFALEQNFPNPFRFSTTIRYRLSRHVRVELTIHDLSGKAVRALVRSRQPVGLHEAVWDGKDEAGKPAKPGTYIFRLHTGEAAGSRQMSFVQ